MSNTTKKFVHHRALNSEKAFKEFLSLSKVSQEILVAEGDICWAYIEGSYAIYMHHPDLLGRPLSDSRVKELQAEGKLFSLENLFEINASVHFIIELKTGSGELKGFFMEFQRIVKKFNVKNLLVDSFSVEQLRQLKAIAPEMKTSLHTKSIFKRYVLESSFEKPYFKLHNLYKLDFIDYITLSYATTHVNLYKLDIDDAYKEVYASQKKLNLGSIKSYDALQKACNSKAKYIYLRSNRVKKNYTKLLKGKK